MYDISAVLGRKQAPVTKFLGYILTTATGFSVYAKGHLGPVAQIRWTRGGDEAQHLAAVTMLAERLFERPLLRSYTGVGRPCGFEKWGWTRSTRPSGSCSVEITNYSVWASDAAGVGDA